MIAAIEGKESHQPVHPRRAESGYIIIRDTQTGKHIVNRLGLTLGIVPAHGLVGRQGKHAGAVNQSRHRHAGVNHRLGYQRIAAPHHGRVRPGHFAVALGRGAHNGAHIRLVFVGHSRTVGATHHRRGSHRSVRTHEHRVAGQRYQRSGRSCVIVHKRHHRHLSVGQR